MNNNISKKEYIRPSEVKAIFSIDRTTIYDWMKNDSNFPAIIKPSNRITLINKAELENYLKSRNK